MGVVYLAQDTQLDRPVALKVLPSETTADPQRLRRFLQEARAASKISGAHAAHIYEISESEGTHFIAMEYVEGEPLAVRIAGRPLPPSEVAHLGAQIAEALDEAHARGVTHRDIKPQNVIVTPRGAAKVLDFGLAKLTGAEQASEVATRVKTNPGTVMGTVSYMSPEQALGRGDLDHRTDIFSLGVVLYEMTTGRLPFEGATVTETIDLIVHAQPLAVARLNYDAPAELELIIKKALRKNRDERYQTARDLMNDLRALARELASAELREHPVAPADRASLRDEQATAIPQRSDAGQTRSASTQSRTPEDAAARATASSVEYVVTGIRRHKWAVVIVLAVLTTGVGFALYSYSGRDNPSLMVFQNFTASRITTSGRALEANISPDGKYVVYLEMGDDGSRGLFVRQTATGNKIPIVAPTKGNVLKGTTFSPDGNFVYYNFTDRTKRLALYQVSSVGGTPKKVLDVCDSIAAVSPDGRKLAFIRYEGQTKSNLLVASADGTGERALASLDGGAWFSDAGPAWSPDGKTLAIAAGIVTDGSQAMRLLAIDTQTGATTQISPQRWVEAGRVVWMPDATALIVVATERADEVAAQVWRVAYPSGEAARVTNDVLGRDQMSLGVTADGRTLLTVTEQILSRIETVAAGGDTSRLTRLTSAEANREGFDGFDWVPDGRVVFSSFEGDQSDLWVMNSDGSERRRLTSDIYFDSYPAVTPDGRFIVFQSNRPEGAAVWRLWRMDIDGGNLVQLTTQFDHSPDISPDGRWVVYASWSASEGKQRLWKVPLDGGEPIRLTEYAANDPTFSPDGRSISCNFLDEHVTPTSWGYGVIPAEGGRPVRQFRFPGYQYQRVRWKPDSRNLSHIGSPPDPSNIWLQPAEGGEPDKLTDFKSDYIYHHAWSPDGKMLALARGRHAFDVVVMRDKR
jgi:Tol biopolymer transport system component/serine/threonine protein kinase